MGVLKLGFLANLLSHPVVSGFITASGIIIATSQLKSILGTQASGEAMPEKELTVIAYDDRGLSGGASARLRENKLPWVEAI